MSRREKDKAKSLDALARFAYGSTAPPPAPRPAAPATPRPPPRAPPPSSALRPPPSRGDVATARARGKQLEERRAKLQEEQALKTRRQNELARGSSLPWRGMDNMNVPASIRRTGFDRDEPTVAQKLHDVLGDLKEKEGRVKHRAKGRRQS